MFDEPWLLFVYDNMMSYLIVPTLFYLKLSSAFRMPMFGSSRLPTFLEHSPNAVRAIGFAKKDVYSQICNYSPTQITNSSILVPHNIVSLEQPLDVPEILRDIVVDSNVHHGGWAYGLKLLYEIENCPAVAAHVKSFKFSIWAQHSPPYNLASTLARILGSFKQLEKLELVIPEPYTDLIEAEFRRTTLRFAGLHTLILSPYMQWMVDLTPNIKSLSTQGWPWKDTKARGKDKYSHKYSYMLMEAAGRLEKLEQFLMDEHWQLDMVEGKDVTSCLSDSVNGGVFSNAILSTSQNPSQHQYSRPSLWRFFYYCGIPNLHPLLVHM